MRSRALASVYDFEQLPGWGRYTLASAGPAAPGSKIRAISKSVGHTDLLWVSSQGAIEGERLAG